MIISKALWKIYIALYIWTKERLSKPRIPNTAIHLKIYSAFKFGGINDSPHSTFIFFFFCYTHHVVQYIPSTYLSYEQEFVAFDHLPPILPPSPKCEKEITFYFLGQKKSMQIEIITWVSLWIYLDELFPTVFLKVVVFQEIQTVLNEMMNGNGLTYYQKHSPYTINVTNLYCCCYSALLKRWGGFVVKSNTI